MSGRLKLSSIIIAKNEEANIGRCLESQINCIDEVVVIIDDSTTDGTEEIVKKYSGVRYEFVKWSGFSGTKKHAISLTTNNWVLWIDADEVITSELSGELNEFKKSIPGFTAYSIPRKANFLGRWIMHSGWYPGRVTRLFDKRKVTFNDNDVHEGLSVDGEIGRLKNDLEHYTDPTVKHYFEKYNNYTTLAAEELNKKGKKASVSDIVLRPIFIFFKMYVFRAGFLDGLQGLILAVFSSSYVFTKYCKLWELNRKKD